jgi:hypothetical protein
MVQANCFVPIEFMTGLREYRIEYYVTELPEAAQVNAAILDQYRALADSAELKRSHYFEGRYENIYVPEQRLPALQPVLAAARRGASRFLRREQRDLAVGFWLNEMGPGHRTLPHSHDEDDELVSGVYYVRVPEDSGELILTQGAAVTRVTAREGMFVFFPPQVVHEVSENRSGETRLSIGMNFGVRQAHDASE